MKLFRNLKNGKIYTKPLPKGEYYPLPKNNNLYDLRGFEKPKFGKNSKWVVRINN